MPGDFVVGTVFNVSRKINVMKFLIVVVTLVLLLACNDNNPLNNAATTNKSADVAPASTPIAQESSNDGSGCYMKITGRDTAILKIEQKGNELSGKMMYDNFEKDGSIGTVKGKKDGDILKLYYDFNSEGTRSVMEVYFKEVPGGLLRGIGDMDVKGDTAYFRSGINYSDKEAFSKIDCNLMKQKL